MSDETLHLKVYPNPLQGDQLQLSFQLNTKGTTQLFLIDALGRVIQHINLGVLSPGIHQQQISLAGADKGWHYLQLNTSKQSQALPLFRH